MLLTVTLNPAVDNALFLPKWVVGDANRVVRADRDAGGKGVNQSRVVTSLGGSTVATGFLGGTEGAYIKAVLDRGGIPHQFVDIEGETRENFSVEDDSKSPPTSFNLPGPTITELEWSELIESCRRLAPSASWAAMAGSLPIGVPVDAYRILGDLFREQGVRTILDADGEVMRQGLLCRPTFIKPNEPEASRLLQRSVETTSEAVAAAQELTELCDDGGFVVLSRGAKGAVLACPDGIWIGESPKVQVKSTMGSGDSMIAGLIWALDEGRPLDEALRWGLAAGAATAATDGTKIASGEMIRQLVDEARVRPA